MATGNNMQDSPVTASGVDMLLTDARNMHEAALVQMKAGDIRDAAEKAWCATLQAANAVIAAHAGVIPDRTPKTSQWLNALKAKDRRFEPLVGRYYSRQGHLHGEVFYFGLIEPRSEVERRIIETEGYIADAAKLAALPTIGATLQSDSPA